MLRAVLLVPMLGMLVLPAAMASPGAPRERPETAAQPATTTYYQGAATQWQPAMTQPQVESSPPLVILALLVLSTVLGLTVTIRALLNDIRQRRAMRRNWRHSVDGAI